MGKIAILLLIRDKPLAYWLDSLLYCPSRTLHAVTESLRIVRPSVLFLLLFLISCLVQAEKISIDQLHEAIIALTEGKSEPYHVIDNMEVYEYYSKTVGRHNKR